MKNYKKILKILQGATNLMMSIFSKIHLFSIVCGDLKLNKKNMHTKVYKYNEYLKKFDTVRFVAI